MIPTPTSLDDGQSPGVISQITLSFSSAFGQRTLSYQNEGWRDSKSLRLTTLGRGEICDVYIHLMSLCICCRKHFPGWTKLLTVVKYILQYGCWCFNACWSGLWCSRSLQSKHTYLTFKTDVVSAGATEISWFTKYSVLHREWTYHEGIGSISNLGVGFPINTTDSVLWQNFDIRDMHFL